MSYQRDAAPGTYDHSGRWCDQCQDQTSHYRPGKSDEPWTCTQAHQPAEEIDCSLCVAVEDENDAMRSTIEQLQVECERWCRRVKELEAKLEQIREVAK